jgi:hypothetical protein
MADYVRIHKGARELSVSRKAFNSIYKEKGFELVGGKGQNAASEAQDGGTGSPASRKGASKAASKKKTRTGKAAKQSPASQAAEAETGGTTGLPSDES